MNKFKCKDEVIYRRNEDSTWTYGIYSHKEGCIHCLVGASISGECQILPYKDYEYLVGTTDNPEEEITLKRGEYVVVSDFHNRLSRGVGVIRQFYTTGPDTIYTEDLDEVLHFSYCIPLKDYNINDMEETRKHILCVKNGKLIRYGK